MGELIKFPTNYDPELTYKELATVLNCSVRKVHNLRGEGMPSCNIGHDGKRRFKLSEVQDWLRRRDISA